MVHGPRQTYKHVCLSHTIICHLRQHLKIGSFHIKTYNLPTLGLGFHMAWLAGALCFRWTGTLPSPLYPPLTYSSDCITCLLLEATVSLTDRSWHSLCWKRWNDAGKGVLNCTFPSNDLGQLPLLSTLQYGHENTEILWLQLELRQSHQQLAFM